MHSTESTVTQIVMEEQFVGKDHGFITLADTARERCQAYGLQACTTGHPF